MSSMASADRPKPVPGRCWCINLLTSGTFGDGDAAGFTTGDETETDFEDLYVGWRNEMFEVSAGSQNITIGDGFLVNGDALNFGKGFEAIPGAPIWIGEGLLAGGAQGVQEESYAEAWR